MPTPKDMIIGKYYYTSDIDMKRGISNQLIDKIKNTEQSDIYATRNSKSGDYILKFNVDVINRTFNEYAGKNTNYDEDMIRNTKKFMKEACETCDSICTISGGKKTRRKIKRKKPRKSIKNNKRKSSKK
tara:strand:- start:1192 stop:1578 length:387 start_codon:yes stop_codon:yes gene_type:complete